MSQPTPETFPIAGGNYVQHPDGRLERVDDAPIADAPVEAAAESEPAPTPSTTPKTRAAKSATPE